jgi:hypothetical protein
MSCAERHSVALRSVPRQEPRNRPLPRHLAGVVSLLLRVGADLVGVGGELLSNATRTQFKTKKTVEFAGDARPAAERAGSAGA